MNTALRGRRASTGYLIAVAVDADGRPVQNNSFLGSAFVRDEANEIIDGYNAEAFAKRSAGAAPLDADGNATLYFDGVNYNLALIQFAAALQDPNRAVQACS